MTPREMPCRHALQVSRAAAMYLGFKCDATSARVSGGRKFHKESWMTQYRASAFVEHNLADRFDGRAGHVQRL